MNSFNDFIAYQIVHEPGRRSGGCSGCGCFALVLAAIGAGLAMAFGGL